MILKATNCMQTQPGRTYERFSLKSIDLIQLSIIINYYQLLIIIIIRGDLEKVKKHLKKNDVNSVDGQGR